MIPVKYNVRNLRVRWVNTLLSVLATGLVVWSSCILFGFVEGLQHSLRVSGDPFDLIVLRKGSTNETNGGYDSSKAEGLLTLDGIARDGKGRPLIALELLNIPVIERVGGGRANIIVRGIDPVSRELRPDFTIVAGRDFEPGKGECIVSKNLSRRFQGAGLGEVLKCGDREQYRVVGLFTAGGSSAESEVWLDRKDLEQRTAREGSVSSVQLRAASSTDLDRLIKTVQDDQRFKLAAIPEVDYFAAQSRSSLLFKVGGTIIAILLTIGAMFAAANTMYAAVRTRTREIGTMRALGFSKVDVLICFLGESLLLCVVGGAVGLLATIPLRVITYGTSNFDTFSEVTFRFRFGPLVIGVAVGMTIAMGLVGGLFPALRAVRMDVIKALREV
jgi:putative ABC transport system permease protein